MLKKNNGITMMSLVVTIVVLLMLSSITINIGVENYNIVKVQNFVAQLKVIQAKVDNIAEENDDVSGYEFVKLSEQDGTDEALFTNMIEQRENYNISVDLGNVDDYYYFTPQYLEEKLGLKNQDLTVIINFKTRTVISKKGVKQDGEMYYTQYDLGGENLE